MAAECSFEFKDLRTVVYEGPNPGVTHDLKLVESGLQFDTLLGLSVYVRNTHQTACDPGLLKILGQHLFDFLLPEKAATPRTQVLTMCEMGAVHITMRFHPQASRYAQLPWEFLTVPDGNGAHKFLSDFDDVKVTLTRHVPTQQTLSACDDKIRVLVDVASPSDQAEITYANLEAKLNELEDRSGEKLEFRIEHGRSLQAIREDMNEWHPDIFHFSGHGERNALWLASKDTDDDFRKEVEWVGMTGKPLGFGPTHGPEAHPEPFRAGIEAVGKLFSQWAPKLVILDACTSDWSWLSEMLPGIAHQLVTRVPAVIAMRYPISNGEAESFATELYQGILEGLPLDRAVQRARNTLAQRGIGRAYGTPVLYVDSSGPLCNPGFVFVEPPEAAKQAADRTQIPPPCPRCQTIGLFTKAFCAKCGVPFRCRACEARFDEHQIKRLNFCPECGQPCAVPPWPPRPDDAAGQPPAPPPPSVPTANQDRLASGHGSTRVLNFPRFRSGGDDDAQDTAGAQP